MKRNKSGSQAKPHPASSGDGTITLNGVRYIREGDSKHAIKDNMPHVVVRTYSAGVHAGFLKKRDGKVVELLQSRRIWQWDGAASLSQLALEGVKAPDRCKFSVVVDSIILTEAIEIIPTTAAAQKNINEVPVWKR